MIIEGIPVKIVEGSGLRVSFKELLLLKGIVNAITHYGYKRDGMHWVSLKAAVISLTDTAMGLSKASVMSAIDKAVGNNLVTVDDDAVGLTKMGLTLIKATEPEIAAKLKLKESSMKQPKLVHLDDVGLSHAAKSGDLIEFGKELEKVLPWVESSSFKRIMETFKKGKQVFSLRLDYTDKTASQETNFRRNIIEDYKKKGYTYLTFGLLSDNCDEFIFYK